LSRTKKSDKKGKFPYKTGISELVIREKEFRILKPGSLDEFLDHEDLFHNFPLWAKIWEASIVLADYLGEITVEPEKRFLEIGCGLGLVGIVAASYGHKITMTEHNRDALRFARANAAENLPGNNSLLEIRGLDWNKPRPYGLFDYIVGSEVLYKETDFQPLLRLIKTYLKPTGEVILAEGIRKTSMEFFKQMGQFFDIKARKKVLRSKEKEITVMLCSMRYKPDLEGSG